MNGQTVTDPVKRVREGATVTLDLAARNEDKRGLPDEAVVFLDPHVVVVEKPAGVATVPYDPEGMGASIAKRPQKRGDAVTLDELVRQTLARKERRKGTAPPDIGVVHRRYLAIVHGDAKTQTIESHLVPDRGDGVRGSVEKRGGRKYAVGSERTQRAVTHVEVLERLSGKGAGQPCTLVACRLETGRTHQIRIHLAEAGFPLLGERVYVRDRTTELVPSPRMMLHAAELGFVHPATERAMKWTSPLPAAIEEMLAFLRT